MPMTNAEKQKAWRETRKTKFAQAQQLATGVAKRALKTADTQLAVDAAKLSDLLKQIKLY